MGWQANKRGMDLIKRDLRSHKRYSKRLSSSQIVFAQGHRLKAPLHEIVRSKRRTHTTKIIQVSDDHHVCFLWRDGEVRAKSAFYGWLLHGKSDDSLKALAAIHYHPSHKPAHIVSVCDLPDDVDHQALGRGCPELMLDDAVYDPRCETDRLRMIERFCAATGIEIVDSENYDAPASQSLDLRPL